MKKYCVITKQISVCYIVVVSKRVLCMSILGQVLRDFSVFIISALLRCWGIRCSGCLSVCLPVCLSVCLDLCYILSSWRINVYILVLFSVVLVLFFGYRGLWGLLPFSPRDVMWCDIVIHMLTGSWCDTTTLAAACISVTCQAIRPQQTCSFATSQKPKMTGVDDRK